MQETTNNTNNTNLVLMSIDQALVVRERYVCSRCWGQLNVYFDHSGPARVTCDRCGDGHGFVSKRFAERRRQVSRGEAIEVRELLARIGVVPHVVHTVDELLAEIGKEG